MNTNDINWLNLILGSLILIIPFLVFLYFKTGLAKAMVISMLRMGVQLFLVGFYLKYIFEWNLIWLNITWLIIMVIAASLTIYSRSGFKVKEFIIPISAGIVVGLALNSIVIDLVVLGNDSFLNARVMIPIAGMLIGNTLGASYLGIKSCYSNILKEEEKFKYAIICGATRKEAMFPYITESLKLAFNPTIVTNSSIGLIWLPGMMTGQILGGSNPLTAIKYQILIIVGIFVSSVLTVITSIIVAQKFAFTEYDLLKKNIF
jgi:putative ABC transport system permease protein